MSADSDIIAPDIPSHTEAFASSGQEPEALLPCPPLPETDPLWRQALETLPLCVAILDASTRRTLWNNAALQTQWTAATGKTQILGRLPAEYLPGLDKTRWEEIAKRLLLGSSSPVASSPHRFQFVDHATRNIAYWEWALQTMGAETTPRYFLLTLQNVSESVMNERLLASSGRLAERARKRAEALGRLTQLVNASETTSDILRIVTQETATFFEAHHAAVLLLNSTEDYFEVGYSQGIASHKERYRLNRAHTLADLALLQRKTLVVTHPAARDLKTPLLEDNSEPITIVSSPIWHSERDYGTVEVYFSEARDIPTDARALLTAFADQTAIALHKADLNQQIAAQRRQLQSIFDHAPVGIVYFDTDLRVVAVNAAAAHIYGRPAQAIVGHLYSDFLANVPAGLFETVREGEPFHASHYVYSSPNLGEIVCDVSLLPIRDNGGNVSGLLLLTFEVTELVKARQEADAAREAAENALSQARAAQSQMVQMEKMRAIGELASGVAHDFNNALMAILGYAELAQDSLDDPEALSQQLGIIVKAAQDASSTVQRLQRFARQRATTRGEATDVNLIVQDVLEMTRPRWKDGAQKEGRVYRVKADLQEVPLIFAEPSSLREVLINMIHNALNAMPDGGGLTFSTRSVSADRVEISVADTGRGMTPEVANRIFDPFFTTRGVEGTGLGLAVSWAIIQRHGGTIEVDTAPGKGTCFHLRLPVQESGEVAAMPEERVRTAKPLLTQGARLLVVDDEPFVASVLTSILTRHGHRVTTAHSAQEALDRLRDAETRRQERENGSLQTDRETQDANEPYQMVLTDHGMPGMTGLQLVAEIKRNWPAMPVLLLTGWGENLLQTHVAETLPDAVLGKPINQSDLLDAVSRILRLKAEAEAKNGASDAPTA